jgi:hypothetical protein
LKTNRTIVLKQIAAMLTQTSTIFCIIILICAFASVSGFLQKLKNTKEKSRKHSQKKRIMPTSIRSRVYKKPASYIENEYLLESWDDGEVAWDLEPFHYSLNENEKENKNPTILPREVNKNYSNNREKIWGLLEELRINGFISGVLNVAYYNTAVSDNIINDLQNIELKPNDNLSNAITKNYNSELDIIFTILTIIAYKKYQEERIPVFIQNWDSRYAYRTSYKNNYINEYRKIRRITTIIALSIIVVFCKSVKSAAQVISFPV